MSSELNGFRKGDAVEKVGGDYTFKGVVVSCFHKKSGVMRYVVEDDRGVLHIYSAKCLRLAGTSSSCPSQEKAQ